MILLQMAANTDTMNIDHLVLLTVGQCHLCRGQFECTVA